MFDLYLLKYFLGVVETGSFTKAAEKSNVTQPTLSAGIKKLEEQIGKPLFERTHRRVFLTEAGTRFLPRAKSILHECNMAMQDIVKTESMPLLRLGVLNTFSQDLLTSFLKETYAAIAGLVIEVSDGSEQELVNRLQERSIDYAISIIRNPSDDGHIQLYKEDYCFIMAKHHPLAHKKQLKATELQNQEMVVRSRCEVLSETSRFFTQHNVRPRLVYRTLNDSKAISMVEAGVGATVVPRSLVNDRVSSHDLSGFSYSRNMGLFKPKYRLPDVSQDAANTFEAIALDCFRNI